ncbi:hypothetical protein JQK15_13525 [Sphingobium sp. BHU LFT2]|uniref:hypothetical protein n=1 Tax=Sphingobium sp. BHU LFT2 TaxID=2807634 RepID=UPI001BE90083|nr:hypothetical protein [Sphingobium sp. BHU LFT2]MBT2244559.1 hypothetical protein [Sphingobium sp. BHU LFT2]
MRIDNDFLTLLDLTVKLAMAKANRPVVAYPAERERDLVNIENMTLKRDALVAKINAADDARRKEELDRVAAMFKLADWHDRKRARRSAEILSQIDKVMGGPAGEERDAAVAMLLSDLKASRATIDAIAADLKKREASMVEAKDAAPAPTFEQKLREFMAKPSEPKGFTTCGATLDEAINKLIKAGCPIQFERVCGGAQYFARWNVSPKDAGEGR